MIFQRGRDTLKLLTTIFSSFLFFKISLWIHRLVIKVVIRPLINNDYISNEKNKERIENNKDSVFFSAGSKANVRSMHNAHSVTHCRQSLLC